MKRALIDRIHDRLWTITGDWLEVKEQPSSTESISSGDASVSGTMDWPLACAALVSGQWTSHDFRKTHAVRQVVETVGPVDGRHYANYIKHIAPDYLTDHRVAAIDAWGDPIRWPGILLGTPQAFSPTTLRYLAHALWLNKKGFVKEGGTVVEIGVGFGGLAAMNALVSKATTLMVDLEPVAKAAMRQMHDLGFSHHVAIHDGKIHHSDFCVISNYAFTELSSELQDAYVDKFIRHADRGVILSNAAVFAQNIQGRNDDQITDLLRTVNIDSVKDYQASILCSADHTCKVCLIRWDKHSKKQQSNAHEI
jgi:hypothetical protein